MTLVVLAACILGIAGLFFLDHDKASRNSTALWLPVAWIWILGSRVPSMWLGLAPTTGSVQVLDATLEGNSTDALVFGTLEAAGIMVLLHRRRQTGALLRSSVPILIYFTYCIASVLWSPFPDVALKRWFKAVGDLVMALVIVTDPEPIAALRRLYSRVGFILLPASIFLIRYSVLGRGFNPDGSPENIGVTTHKNSLGLITFVIALGAVWNLHGLLRLRDQACRRHQLYGRRLLAQGALLASGVAVLRMAQSATAITCFTLGSGLMIGTGLRAVRRSATRTNAFLLSIAAAVGIGTIFDLDEVVMHMLGRSTNLTGRTEIWKTVIPLARDPIIGAGFESFWNSISQTLHHLANPYMFSNLNSAHNGYLEVYLNLGLVGVSLVGLILVSGYCRAASALCRNSEVGGLILASIITTAVYSITEAGFKPLSPTWIFLLLAVVFGGGISSGCIKLEAPVRQARYWGPDDEPSPWESSAPTVDWTGVK